MRHVCSRGERLHRGKKEKDCTEESLAGLEGKASELVVK